MGEILIVSDIHGSVSSSKKILELEEYYNFEKIYILGDVNYSGARNVPPKDYYPIEVVNNLLKINEKIIFISGNCDSRVDEFVFKKEFFKKYEININDYHFIFTHGDLYNETNIILMKNDVLIMGHSHVYKLMRNENNSYIINDGSITLPKENKEKTYIIFDTIKNVFSLFDDEDNLINTLKLI